MQASINRYIRLGTIDKRGVEVSYHGQGSARASFNLIVSELGSDGREHQAWFPCEIWGKRAEAAGELDPGALCLVEGRLKRVKQGETWTTVVSGFDCTPLQIPAAAVAT